MRRRVEATGLIIAVLLTLSLQLQDAARAGTNGGCPGTDPNCCPAVGWGQVMGTVAVSQVDSNNNVTVTAKAIYPPSYWYYTETGYVASGIGSVSIYSLGTLVDYGPKQSTYISVSASDGGVQWQAGPEDSPPGTGTPTSRFPTPSYFWVIWHLNSPTTGVCGYAVFSANQGYTGYSDNAFCCTPTPAPVIDGISPRRGRASGGTVVLITGSNLADAMSVTFGSAPAASFTVYSDSIQAVSPPGSGAVDVRVTTPGGTSPVTHSDRFRYSRK